MSEFIILALMSVALFIFFPNLFCDICFVPYFLEVSTVKSGWLRVLLRPWRGLQTKVKLKLSKELLLNLCLKKSLNFVL